MTAEFDPLLDALALPASVEQKAALSEYLDLLERWNGVYNLTSVRTRVSMRVQHIADCLAVVGPLTAMSPGGRLLDVGSGGGLPGVIVAILNPERSVTCVDAVGKKAAFVRQIQAELGLPNLVSIHARVERLAAPPFALVISRAFASLRKFVELTGRGALGEGGVWVAMKGQHPTDEIADVSSIAEVFHVEHLQVPFLDAQRCMVWMRPRPCGRQSSPVACASVNAHWQADTLLLR